MYSKMSGYLVLGLLFLGGSVSAQYFQPVVLQGDGSSNYNITICSTDARCGDVVWEEFLGSGTTVQNFYIEKPYVACFNVPFWYTAYNGSNEVIQDRVKSRLFGNMWCGNISLGEGGESYTNIGSYLRIPWFESCAYLNTDADGVFMCQPTMPLYDDTALKNNITSTQLALLNNVTMQDANNSAQQNQINNLTGRPYLPDSCSLGQVPKNQTGTWVCADDEDSGGTVTGATPNGGLLLDGTTLGLVDTCSNGQVLKNQSGGWMCANDIDTNGGGTVTNVDTQVGSGLVGGPITLSGTLGIDSSILANWTGADLRYYPMGAGNSLSLNSTDLYARTDTLATNSSRLAAENVIQLNTSTAFGGDVSGTYDNLQVTDDSHAHTDTSIGNDLTIETTKALTVGGGFASGGTSLTTDGGTWTQYLVVMGNVTVGVIVNGNVSGDFLPSLDNSWNLGNNSRRWKAVWGVLGNFTTLYEGGLPLSSKYVDRNTWTTIDNYPTACGAGQYVTTVGDTLTCATPTGTAALQPNINGANITSGLIGVNYMPSGWLNKTYGDTLYPSQTLSSSGSAGNIAVNISLSGVGVTCQTLTGGSGLCDGTDADTTQTLASSGAAGSVSVNISGSGIGVTCATLTGSSALCDGGDANSGGTVTSVAGEVASGITGGTITSSGTLGINSTIIANWTGATAKYMDAALAKDLVTTAPITGGTDNILPGADADVTIAITMLGDLATTAPITGAANDIFPGATGAKATIGLTLLKDLNPVTGSGIICAGDDVLPGADADVNIGIDSSIIANWTGADARYLTSNSYGTTQLYGDGSDGAVSLTANSKLTRDMYYDNLTVSNNAILNSSGYKIFVRRNLTIASGSSIAATGGTGGNGGNGGLPLSPGSTGAAGAAANAAASLPTPLAGVAGAVGGVGAMSSGAGTTGNQGTTGVSQTNALRGTVAGSAGVSGGNGGNVTAAPGYLGGPAGSGGLAGTRTELAANSGDMRDMVRATNWATITGAGSIVVPAGGSGAGAGGSGGGGAAALGASLSGWSLVSTPDGYVNIRNLNVGDKVYSWNGSDITVDEVSGVSSHILDWKVKHIIINGILDVTHNHVIYTHRGWLQAENITVGDILLGESMQEMRVDSVSAYLSQDTVYDLEVKDTHNFFAGGYLVHNVAFGGGSGGGSGGSGGNGGYVYIAAQQIFNSGSITATGGAGGSGGNGGDSNAQAGNYGGGGGGGGGGSGGTGGVIVIITNSNSVGTVTAAGGVGGAKGTGGTAVGAGSIVGSDGNNGTTGAVGLIIQIKG